MRAVLSHRSDAVFLVLGIVGVNATVALATLVPGRTDAEFAVWPAVGVGAAGVLAFGALWVAVDSISISIRKFGDRSMSRAAAKLRALGAFLSPHTYRQAAGLLGIPTVVVVFLVAGSLTMSVVSVIQS